MTRPLSRYGQYLWSEESWMGVLLSVDGPSGSAEPVEELPAGVWAAGTGARSLCARLRSLSGAVFAGERR